LGWPPPDTPYLFAKLLKNWFRSTLLDLRLITYM
jgi:hypothetical protein